MHLKREVVEKLIIAKVINEWDPIGLLSVYPPSEYTAQITIIYEESLKLVESNPVTLGNLIYLVFKQAFITVFDKTLEECQEVARDIIDFDY